MKKTFRFSNLLTIAVVTMLLISWQTVTAQTCTQVYDPTNAGVYPELVSGNPVLCSGGVRIHDPLGTQTYSLGGGKFVTIEVMDTDCGPVFKYTASPGVTFDRIVVKGGSNANVYNYSDAQLTGTDFWLHSPLGPNRKFSGLSHIDFCIRYSLDVEKTALTKYTRKHEWKIEKLGDAEYDLFVNDGQLHEYEIKLTKTTTEYDFFVYGDIVISNNSPFSSVIASVSDFLTVDMVDIDVDVVCGVTFPYTLAAGQSLTCTYEKKLDGKDDGTNTAVVATTGDVSGGSDVVSYSFDDATVTVIGYDEVTVTDPESDDSPWTFSASGSVFYEKRFFCGADDGGESFTYPNTATIVETEQTASASVVINCWALEIEKDAHTSFDRRYYWDITKVHDAGADCIELAFGELLEVNYTVTVTMTGYVDSNWAVEGEITVTNPSPIAATINSLSDIITPGDIVPVLDCDVSFPLVLAAGASFTCSYSAALPNADTRLNTATVVLQNFDYHFEDPPLATGTTSFSGTADVDFSEADINDIDKCVDVFDKHDDLAEVFLGEVCYPFEEGENVFEFSHLIGIADGEYDCGFEYEVPNRARFITLNTETVGYADELVCFYIPCTPPGCETAYAMGDDAICFIPDYADNWGWTNPIIVGGGPYVWDLWAAAGQCDITKGTLVGTVSVTFSSAGASGKHHVIVTYNVDPAFTLEETHVHAGTVAYPGPDIGNWTNQGPFDNGAEVYVIAHAVVCGQFTNGAVEAYNNNAGNLPEDADFEATESFDSFQVRSYPNPFSSAVTFNFNLPEESQVELVIYNLSGQVVARVAEGLYNAGNHNVTWTAPANLLNGLYIYRLQTPEHVSIQKMLFAR
jgi:hypothetical protein